MSKSQLILTKKQLVLARQGYELLDKKVFILKKELEALKKKYDLVSAELEAVLQKGKHLLKEANVQSGVYRTKKIDLNLPQPRLEVLAGSIMGVEVPLLNWETEEARGMAFSGDVPKSLYHAHIYFNKSKELVLIKAMLSASITQVRIALKKTLVRANALDYQVIPKQEALKTKLETTLAEQEREEFVRVSLIR